MIELILQQIPQDKKDHALLLFCEMLAAISQKQLEPPPPCSPMMVMKQIMRLVGAEIHFVATKEEAEQILAKAVAEGVTVSSATISEVAIPPSPAEQYEAAVKAEAALRKASGKTH